MCEPMIAFDSEFTFESEAKSESSLFRFRDMSKRGIGNLRIEKVLPSNTVKSAIQHLFKLGGRGRNFKIPPKAHDAKTGDIDQGQTLEDYEVAR